MFRHHRQRVGDISDDSVEADAAEPVARLDLEARVGDEHDVDVARNHRAGELCVPAFQTDVHRADQVTASELLGRTSVEQDRAGLDEAGGGVEIEGLER